MYAIRSYYGPFCPEVPGSRADGIFGLSHLATGVAVEGFLREREPKRAVVVGGGYIGLEMAEALLARGLEVALVQRGSEVMSTLDRDMGGLVSQALREAGVTRRITSYNVCYTKLLRWQP